MTWEEILLHAINHDATHPLLDLAMSVVTVAAMPLLTLLPLAYWLWGKPREASARCASAILLLSILSALGMQFLVARPRPENVRLVLAAPMFPSFPSGHAAVSFGYALFATLSRKRSQIGIWMGALVISFSRLYLGHHFPSDILGGAILGWAAAAVSYGLFYHQPEGIRPRWAWFLWAEVAIVLLGSLSAYLGLVERSPLACRGLDKVLHFVLFGLLAFAAVGWWARQRSLVVLMALSVIATADEGLQSLSAFRAFDAVDLVATLGGILVLGWLGIAAKNGHLSRAASKNLGAPP